MKRSIILLLVVIALYAAGLSHTKQRRLVGNLQNNAVADGCGCYFQFRGTPQNIDRYIFFSGIEDEKTAWMNIAGRDVKLVLKKDTGINTRERVGSRSTVEYAAGDVRVNGTYTVTAVCDPNDESCESTQYSATFVVRKGKRSEVVRAVGSCGC